jgi:hypothetical protein
MKNYTPFVKDLIDLREKIKYFFKKQKKILRKSICYFLGHKWGEYKIVDVGIGKITHCQRCSEVNWKT